MCTRHKSMKNITKSLELILKYFLELMQTISLQTLKDIYARWYSRKLFKFVGLKFLIILSIPDIQLWSCYVAKYFIQQEGNISSVGKIWKLANMQNIISENFGVAKEKKKSTPVDSWRWMDGWFWVVYKQFKKYYKAKNQCNNLKPRKNIKAS